MQKHAHWLSVTGYVALACLTSPVGAAEITLPDQTILNYRFSAMRLAPSVPALNCVVTGPADTSATLEIIVYLFESADGSTTPYAHVSGNAILVAGQRGLCDVNNGQQTIPPKQPKKIEIQVTTRSEVRQKTVTVPVP